MIYNIRNRNNDTTESKKDKRPVLMLKKNQGFCSCKIVLIKKRVYTP